MNTTAAEYAATVAARPYAQRFAVSPNGHGIHARCTVCGHSKAGNMVEAWMMAHDTTCSARAEAVAALRAAIEDDHRINYRAALREVARHATTPAETTTLKAAIQLEHVRPGRDRVHHLVSPAVLDIAGLEAPEPWDMDYLLSSL